MTFLHGEIFEFPIIFFCLKILYNVNGKAAVRQTPCFDLVKDKFSKSLQFLKGTLVDGLSMQRVVSSSIFHKVNGHMGPSNVRPALNQSLNFCSYILRKHAVFS
jgi:hypothetical protein